MFVVLTLTTAVSLIAVAQPKKPATKPPTSAPAKKPPPKPADEADGSAPPITGKEERTDLAQQTSAKDAGKGAAVLEQKTLDGGTKVYRFGEVEVDINLKSPQLVYFLRRVRAEFAAGDLGHRSFMRELDETQNEPSF